MTAGGGVDVLAALRSELDSELAKREKIRADQLKSYETGSATRRRTTTRNANADWCNERIGELRTQIRALENGNGC